MADDDIFENDEELEEFELEETEKLAKESKDKSIEKPKKVEEIGEDFEEVSRKIVIPGDLLFEGNYRPGIGTYSIGKAIYASTIGLLETRGQYANVIPLRGPYIPKVKDLVIGVVVNTTIVSWKLDIYSPYMATLHATNYLNRPFNPLRDDIRQFIDIGEVVFAEIISFNRTRDPVLSVRNRGLGKLKDGRLVHMEPTKIPRLIGRKGSMISLIKEMTRCKFKIGQNGIIWLKGNSFEDEMLVIKIIRKIEREAHTLGLTDRIKEFIIEERKK